MTKRKASVALGTINEEHPNNIQSNAGNNVPTSDLANNAEPGVVQHQNGDSDSVNITGSCQQQDTTSNNQNDNSIVNRNNSGNSNLGTTRNQNHKGKKERADNWSSAEIQILHKGIESRRDIFYGPPSQATKKNRELAWDAITREVNAVSSTPRSISQVMKKFKNEKCRAKRKFDPEKEGHSHRNASSSNSVHQNNNTNTGSNLNANNNVSNSGHGDSTNPTTNNGPASDATASSNLGAQNHNSQQQQSQMQQPHLITSADQSMPSSQPSINVVKLAPQNVAKTMIDLPGHVQQIQMPNDDMVLIVPPDMDSLLSGVNIVSDGNGHHHFQKCSSANALNNHSHSHHNSHSIQTLNTSQGLVNGAMGNGMMTRAIPAGSMCSLVYSTGNEVCAPDHHIAQNVSGQASLTSHHLGLNAQAATHHRGGIDQSHLQQQQQPHQPQLHHQHHLHQQPQQPHQPPQQTQQHTQHQHQLNNPHNQQHLSQSHLNTNSTLTGTGGVAVESQLKNLLFNLLLKDGQHPSVPSTNQTNQDNKHRNDMMAVIASSLTKIEGHLSKISKIASSLIAPNLNMSLGDSNDVSGSNQMSNSGPSGVNMSNSDGNNNSVNITSAASGLPNIGPNRRDNER